MARFLTILLLLLASPAWAASETSLRLAYLKSEATTITTEDATRVLQERLQEMPGPLLNFGYFPGTIWLRVQVATQLPPETRLRIFFDSAFLADVRLYAIEGEQAVPRGVGGIAHRFSERTLPTRLPAFEITAAEAGSREWLLAVRSPYPITTTLQVVSLDGFNRFDHLQQLVIGFFAGAFLVMVFYNLFLYFSIFDAGYLLYALVIFLTHFMVVVGNFGSSNEYFWPESPWLMQHHFVICTGFSLSCNAMLARVFFDTRTQAPRFNIMAWGFFWTGLFIALVGAFSLPIWLPPFANIALATGMLTIIALGAYFSAQGHRAARLFLASWSPLLVSGILIVLALVFSWGTTALFKYFVLVGALFEAVILSVALGYRYRMILLQKKKVDFENSLMRSEMDSAKEIQDAMMPQTFEVPGMSFYHFYRSAARTGGDLYGYFHNKESDVVFVFIGDVTGHGLSSALITSNISGALYSSLRNLRPRDHATMEDYLRTLSANVNNELVRVAKSEKLSTFFIVAFDLKQNRMTMLNAGHLPLMHLTHEKLHVHSPRGSPLGISDAPTFGIKTFDLQPSDRLLLITDGVIERRNLSLRKLSQLLQTSPDAAAFHGTLEKEFAADLSLEDDVTWLLIQWRGLSAASGAA